jgi:hypothetical protein
MPLRNSDAAPASAVIQGRVLSAPGAPSPMMGRPTGVPDVNVTVADALSGKVVSSALSANDGSFRFVVPPGDYAVKGRGNPHLVHVDAGQQLEVDLYLPNP